MTLISRVRSVAALHIDRVQRAGAVIQLGLLVANVSFSVTLLLKWKGGPLWAWIVGTFLVASVAILIFANLWTHQLDMVREMRRASAVHDPPQVYQMVPMQRVMLQEVDLPQMLAQAQILESLGQNEKAMDLRRRIERVARWESLGFIPREEFPENLLPYYLHEEGRQL